MKIIQWMRAFPILVSTVCSVVAAIYILFLLSKRIKRSVGNTDTIKHGAITVMLLLATTLPLVAASMSVTLLFTTDIFNEYMRTNRKMKFFLLLRYSLLLDSVLNPLILVVRTGRSHSQTDSKERGGHRLGNVVAQKDSADTTDTSKSQTA